MNLIKKFICSCKASQLVEKILVAAFSITMGGAVIAYGANVISQNKETDVQDEISGKTYGYNQQALLKTKSGIHEGVSYTSSSSSFTLNGTGDGTGSNFVTVSANTNITWTIGHVYYMSFNVSGSCTGSTLLTMHYRLKINVPAGTYDNKEFYKVEKATANAATNRYCLCVQYVSDPNHTYENFKVENYMFIDLTEWFGAGNEPDYATFKKKFSHSWYQYQPTPVEKTVQEINALGVN